MFVKPERFQGKVLGKTQLSPKIIWLAVEPDRAVPFTEGQYGSWLIQEHRRPLSFASLPQEPSLEFVIDFSPQGVCSTFTLNLAIGDHVDFLAPYGRFVLDKNDMRPLLFIATGSGIAPIRPQIKKALQENPTRAITLIFGNRDEKHMIFTDEFEKLSRSSPSFTFMPVLSEASSHWKGERGLVTELTFQHVPNLADHSIYICGNPSMVKTMQALLLERNIPKNQLHSEQFT
jgi:NAD(P)H-flavin reductase